MRTTVLALHLLAAAVWLGGMVTLGVVALATREAMPPLERAELFRRIGRRFAVVAGAAVVVLIATGLWLAGDRFGLGSLSDSGDGRLVIVKSGLFALTLALAALHGLVVGPRLRALRERSAHAHPDESRDEQIRHAALVSAATSVAMIALTVAIFVLAAAVGS